MIPKRKMAESDLVFKESPGRTDVKEQIIVKIALSEDKAPEKNNEGKQGKKSPRGDFSFFGHDDLPQKV
jgi:hypothetical protein